jgi:hypothetical protein
VTVGVDQDLFELAVDVLELRQEPLEIA